MDAIPQKTAAAQATSADEHSLPSHDGAVNNTNHVDPGDHNNASAAIDVKEDAHSESIPSEDSVQKAQSHHRAPSVAYADEKPEDVIRQLMYRIRALERRMDDGDNWRSPSPRRKRAASRSKSPPPAPKSPPPPPAATDRLDNERRIKAISKVNRMTVNEYERRKFTFDKPYFCADAIMTDSFLRKVSTGEDTAEDGSPSAKDIATNPDATIPPSIHQTPKDPIALAEEPEPIRFLQINSRALIRCLSETTNDAMIIWAPFKSLCYREVKLRAKLKELEDLWGHTVTNQTKEANAEAVQNGVASDVPLEHSEPGTASSAQDPAATTDDIPANDTETDSTKIAEKESVLVDIAKSAENENVSSEKEEKTAESEKGEGEEQDKPPEHVPELKSEQTSDCRKAYLDLKAFMAFYDEWIKPRWDALRSDKVKRVRFSDLASIFQPGDEVMMPGNSQKVWRVLKVTGGRPMVDHLLSYDYGAYNRDIEEQIKTSEKDVTNSTEKKTADKPVAEKPSAEPTTGRKRRVHGDKWSLFKMDGYYIDFDGRNFGAVHVTATIPFFEGLRDVKVLRPYPLRLAGDGGKTQQFLLQEGKDFLKCAQTGLQYYDGRTLTRNPQNSLLQSEIQTLTNGTNVASAGRPARAEDVSSQVVVDFEKCFQYNPEWAPKFGINEWQKHDDAEWDRDRIDSNNPVQDTYIQYLDYFDNAETEAYRKEDDWVRSSAEASSDDRDRFGDEDYLLLPDRVFGFVLQSRTWACFDARKEALRAVHEEDSGWQDLQLPKEHKRTLESLIERHFNNKEAVVKQGHESLNFDFVHGKGKGLIVLLHGPPGVGKTSTAETIAAKYNRPLLPITCGNLGLDISTVEQSLTDFFVLAQAWDCIVLLDEADVFLAARGKDDLHRNALVSVFLRTLEYYTGVLFLTTNRTGAFDEAFRSRIHTALYYDILGRDETEAIWRTNLARLLRHKERNNQKIMVADNGEEIVKYAKVHYDALRHQQRAPWNGRQIRNSFQTAVALAEYQARESGSDVPFLRWEHFRDVVLAADHFERYLVDTRGNTEQELADWEGVRANYQRQDSMHSYNKTQARRPQKMSMNESLQMMKTLRPDTWVSPAPPPQDNMFFNPNQKSEGGSGPYAQGAFSTPQRQPMPGPQGAVERNFSNQTTGPLPSMFGLQSSPSPTPMHAQVAQQQQQQQQPSPMQGYGGYGQPGYGAPAALSPSFVSTPQQQQFPAYQGHQPAQQLQQLPQHPGSLGTAPVNPPSGPPAYGEVHSYGAPSYGGGQAYAPTAVSHQGYQTANDPGKRPS